METWLWSSLAPASTRSSCCCLEPCDPTQESTLDCWSCRMTWSYDGGSSACTKGVLGSEGPATSSVGALSEEHSREMKGLQHQSTRKKRRITDSKIIKVSEKKNIGHIYHLGITDCAHPCIQVYEPGLALSVNSIHSVEIAFFEKEFLSLFHFLFVFI